MDILSELRSLHRGVEDSARASVSSWKNAAITILGASIMFVGLTLASAPAYSYQLLEGSLFYLDEGLIALTDLLYHSSGGLAVALTLLYSVVGGMAIYNIFGQIQMRSAGGIKQTGLLSPGLLVAGCAGCGAGLLGFMGFAGAIAALPFQGNLVRLAGIGLLLYFLGRSGDPAKCDFD